MVTPKVSILVMPLMSPQTSKNFRELKPLPALQLAISPWLIINAQYQTLPFLHHWILVTANLNYLVHQGILNSDLSLGIDHHTLSTFLSSARNNSRNVPITSMPQNLANPLICDPRMLPDPNSRVSPPNSGVANDAPTFHHLHGNSSSLNRSQIAQNRDRYLHSPISTAGVDILHTILPTRIVQMKISIILRVLQLSGFRLRP